MILKTPANVKRRTSLDSQGQYTIYFDRLNKIIFSDLYILKFLDILTKLFVLHMLYKPEAKLKHV